MSPRSQASLRSKITPAKMFVAKPEAEVDYDISIGGPRDNVNESKNGPDVVNLESFKQQLVEVEEQKLLQKKIVQQRLVAYDTKLQLRHGLKKKIKPLTEDASTIPMSFFVTMV